MASMVDAVNRILAQASLPASSTSSTSLSPVKVKDVDVENQAEVDPSAAAITDSDAEAVVRQIRLEADNTIKYRTCSWQKVC